MDARDEQELNLLFLTMERKMAPAMVEFDLGLPTFSESYMEVSRELMPIRRRINEILFAGVPSNDTLLKESKAAMAALEGHHDAH